MFPIDSNGNLSSKTEGSDTWGYEWNALNELICVTKNSVEQARFAYDPLGRRVEKVAGAVTTAYTYDRNNILREVRGSATLRYVHGLAVDEPLTVDDGTALAYYHADGLGSVVKMTDAGGSVTLTRQYDAWGNLELGGSASGYAFTGREWDPEIGLYYYRARYYDSRTARLLSEDPAGLRAGMNRYAYVHGDPARNVDPSGLLTVRRHVDVFPSLWNCESQWGCIDIGHKLTITCDPCGLMDIDLELNAIIQVRPGDYRPLPIIGAPFDKSVVDQASAEAHERRHLADVIEMSTLYLEQRERKYANQQECERAASEIYRDFPIWFSEFKRITQFARH